MDDIAIWPKIKGLLSSRLYSGLQSLLTWRFYLDCQSLIIHVLWNKMKNKTQENLWILSFGFQFCFSTFVFTLIFHVKGHLIGKLMVLHVGSWKAFVQRKYLEQIIKFVVLLIFNLADNAVTINHFFLLNKWAQTEVSCVHCMHICS